MTMRQARADLEKHRNAIVRSLSLRGLSTPQRGDEVDRAVDDLERTVAVETKAVRLGRLVLIEMALNRLVLGEYGICLGCEKPIAPARLRAIPWADRCVHCQEMLELEAQANRGSAKRRRAVDADDGDEAPKHLEPDLQHFTDMKESD